jgi:hypothetical protein
MWVAVLPLGFNVWNSLFFTPWRPMTSISYESPWMSQKTLIFRRTVRRVSRRSLCRTGTDRRIPKCGPGQVKQTCRFRTCPIIRRERRDFRARGSRRGGARPRWLIDDLLVEPHVGVLAASLRRRLSEVQKPPLSSPQVSRKTRRNRFPPNAPPTRRAVATVSTALA